VTSKPSLIEQLTKALERLRALPQTIAGFFGHPHCRNILDATNSA
jgi:hypothetical protein